MQIVAGLGVLSGSVMTGNIIGAAFGSMMILHGANGVQEGALNMIKGRDDTVGMLKQGYIAVACFGGFSSKTGMITYSAIDLLLSGYGLARLAIKPDTWRLFRYISSDYTHGFTEMSKFDLSIEIYNNTLAIKSINDSQ
jgi:hypothetical protein